MNLLQLSGGERLVGIVRRHLPFLVVAVASTTVGALLVRRLDPDVIRVALGLVTLGWLALGLFKVSVAITPARERWAAPLLGALAGVIGGATTIFFPIMAIYLLGVGVDRRQFIKAISSIFALLQIVQLGALAVFGAMTGPRLLYALAVSVPCALGFALGQVSQRRLDQARFMRAVRLLLAATALQLVYRGLAG